MALVRNLILNSYIGEKYAGLLNEDDVENVFDILAKKLGGNRSEAARRCGLTGKATYDWGQAAYIKLGTKRKVLNAALKDSFSPTVQYLLEQISERNLDLLRTVLETFYANALDSISKETFEVNMGRFEEIRNLHRGLIKDGIENEVTDMSTSLRGKAELLGLPVGPKMINEFSIQDILSMIQLMGHLYAEDPSQAEALGLRDMNLPVEVVKPIIWTFQNLAFTEKLETNAINDSHVKAKHRFATAENPAWTVYTNVYRSLVSQDIWTKAVTGKIVEGGLHREITTTA